MRASYMAFRFATDELINPFGRNIPSDFSELKRKLEEKGYKILTSSSIRKFWGIPRKLIVFGESRKQIKIDMDSVAKEVNLPFKKIGIDDFI